MDASIRTPSTYQQAVIDFIKNGSGDARISAVAGSGKTSTLFMAAGVLETDNALFCAFSKDVSIEIGARLKAIDSKMLCKTMHSIGMTSVRDYLWGSYRRKVQVANDKYDKLIEPFAGKIHDMIMRDYRTALRRREEPDEPTDFGKVKGWISKTVEFVRSTLTDYNEIDAVKKMADYYGVEVDPRYWLEVWGSVKSVIDSGAKMAGEMGLIDFTDMIYLPYRWSLEVEQYDWIFVDECQDLSAAQLHIALKSRALGGRMLFVGDNFQSIYGFTGADPESFNRIKEITGAVDLPLSICYRCPTRVINLAREIVPHIEAAPGASDGILETIESDAIVGMVREGDMILSRRVAPLVALCIRLISRGVPARVKGRDIGKSLTAILKDIAKRDDFSFERFITCLAGYYTRKVMKIKADDNSVDAKIESLEDRLMGILAVYNSDEFDSMSALIERIEGRLINGKMVGGLFSDEKHSITLSSIHKAKGLEADRVFIVDHDRIELNFPGMRDWQKYQERCCHYVALTRARKELYLVLSPRMKTDDQEESDETATCFASMLSKASMMNMPKAEVINALFGGSGDFAEF